ncbi:MAG: hypothetical protein ACO29V_08845 [Limnohabitans sp.]
MALRQSKADGSRMNRASRQSRSTARRRSSTTATTGTSKYRSKFEVAVAASLNKRGLGFGYEDQALPYRIEAVYKPDFCLPNGVLVETKGHFSPEDRRKMLAVKQAHPALDIRLCFQNAKVKLSRAPKSLAYWQWAERHGFPWCEGHIPTAWFNAVQVS